MLDSDERWNFCCANSTATKIRGYRALSASAIRTSHRKVWLFHWPMWSHDWIASEPRDDIGPSFPMSATFDSLCADPSLLSFSPSLFFSVCSSPLYRVSLFPRPFLFLLLLLSVFDSSTKWDEVVGVYSWDLILRLSSIIDHSIRIITGIITPINREHGNAYRFVSCISLASRPQRYHLHNDRSDLRMVLRSHFECCTEEIRSWLDR